jgi:hypothetical protein
MRTIHQTPASAAKAIRKELKDAFPGVKFSVRTQTYSMGNSINVGWSFGPTVDEVREVIGKYEYGRFDSMTDYAYSEHTMVIDENGEECRLGGCKHLELDREIDEEEAKKAARWIKKLCGRPEAHDMENIYGNDDAVTLAYRAIRRASLPAGRIAGIKHHPTEVGFVAF